VGQTAVHASENRASEKTHGLTGCVPFHKTGETTSQTNGSLDRQKRSAFLFFLLIAYKDITVSPSYHSLFPATDAIQARLQSRLQKQAHCTCLHVVIIKRSKTTRTQALSQDWTLFSKETTILSRFHAVFQGSQAKQPLQRTSRTSTGRR
jgi:hypothetical protein